MADPQNYGNKTQVNTNSHFQCLTEYIHRISLEGLSEEARDAIEIALGGKLLTGPDNAENHLQSMAEDGN